MKHLGDITKINGHNAPVVDCIIGGSPCQDLSVAGKRAGLDGERSGLYMEQIRIVKEMREQDVKGGRTGVDIRPRYMVWENVPGAFSSNKGEDFRVVLEEIAKVNDKDAVIPMPDKGKWTSSGCIVGDGWSVAWRVLDAQFWGVPQRRRRIALVADFGGQSAPEILFIRESVSGNSEPSESEGQTVAGGAERSVGADDNKGVCYGISSFNSNAMMSSNPHSGIYEAKTSRTRDLNGGNPCCNQGGIAIVKSIPYTLKIRSGCEGGGKGALVQEDKSATLACNNDQYLFQPIGADPYNGDLTGDKSATQGVNCGTSTGRNGVVEPIGVDVYNQSLTGDKSKTLNSAASDADHVPCAVYSVENHPADSRVNIDASGKVQTLTSRMGTGGGNVPMVMEKATCFREGSYSTYVEGNAGTIKASDGALGGGSENLIVFLRYIVRRLTPMECERLQGYPDGWTDIGEYIDSNGKKRQTSDAARYKALGNSIAIPPWKWVLKRLCACYERDATMASLFDGIGGFPYIWEQLNGKGSCLWASEIEEFPMAVTKVRIS